MTFLYAYCPESAARLLPADGRSCRQSDGSKESPKLLVGKVTEITSEACKGRMGWCIPRGRMISTACACATRLLPEIHDFEEVLNNLAEMRSFSWLARNCCPERGR
mmetsp:Transcript_24763/g.53856  ORF Transcript_24763/g.53856 Transcript_24763/m.53856 type:complete len:106 (-) Transcript_24763:1628-1945(-)